MKLLVLSQYFWPETFRINEVVVSLRQVGCEVTVLTGQPNYPEGKAYAGYRWLAAGQQQHSSGYTIFRVPLIPRGHGSALRLLLNYLSFIVSVALVGPWLLRGQRFDAILVYAPTPILQAIPAVWLAWLKNAKLITWVQDIWPESLSATGFVRSPKILSMVATWVRWIYRHNDALLVPSQAFVEPVTRMAGKTPVLYHPNPGEVGFAEVDPNAVPALQLAPGFNVVFAGNLGTVQALDTVLAAAELLRGEAQVRFVLVGSGSKSRWLECEIERRKLRNVQLPGRLAPQEMPAVLAQASALLVSLVQDPIMSQTVPSKIPAYLAAGKPIIAALDGEGARVVLEAGAGLACPAENARALADAVLQLRDAPVAQRLQMGERARAYYTQNFEPDRLARRMVQLLSNVTNQN